MRNIKGWLVWPWMKATKCKANTPKLNGFINQITRELDRLRDNLQPLVVPIKWTLNQNCNQKQPRRFFITAKVIRSF